MNKCSKCGTEFEGKFCPECGTKADDKVCPECGAHVAAAAKFCPECGHAFNDVSPSLNGGSAPTTHPVAPVRPAAPMDGTARPVPGYMGIVLKALNIASAIILPLFALLMLLFFTGAAEKEIMFGTSGESVYATMRAGGKEGGAMVALLMFAIIGLILGAAAVFMLVRKNYTFKTMIAASAATFVVCLAEIIVCAAFGKAVKEASFGLAKAGAGVGLTLGFGITFMILSLLVLAGRIVIAVLFPSVKEEVVVREKTERRPMDKTPAAKKLVTIIEWIMALAPMAFAILTLIFFSFPLVSLDEEVYGVKSVGNFYSGKLPILQDGNGYGVGPDGVRHTEFRDAQLMPLAIISLVLGILIFVVRLIMQIRVKKTTLGFAIISLCIPMVVYIIMAIIMFPLPSAIHEFYIVDGLAELGEGVSAIKAISLIFAITSLILFVLWLVIKCKCTAEPVKFFGGRHKVLSVIGAFLMSCGLVPFSIFGYDIGILGNKHVAENVANPNRWDAFGDYYKSYSYSTSGFGDPIELPDGKSLYVSEGVKMIYENRNKLMQTSVQDADEYEVLMYKIMQINAKLSSAPFKAVTIQKNGNTEIIEYDPNYKLYNIGEDPIKTVSAARATAYDTAYCVDARTGAKTKTPLTATYGMYRLDFVGGGYRTGKLPVFEITANGDKNSVTWADEYGPHTAIVDTGVELFTIDSEGALARTNSSVAKVMWDNIPSPITSFVVPDGVTAIGEGTFKGCSTLASIDIPDSVTSIGDGAFEGCKSLQPSTAESNAKYLGNSENPYLYLWEVTDKAITDFAINERTKIIGENAFKACSNLTSITLPASVTHIGDSAFSGCSGLTSITLPASITSIGDYAFSGCSGLTSITLPASVTAIGGDAFKGCSGLTSITIPASVTSIGSWAFWKCTNLQTVNFENPNGWKVAGNSEMWLAEDILSSDLQNQSTAAQYLRDTYYYYYWKRS